MTPKPETYWEERCCIMEGAVERLFAVMMIALPHTELQIQSIINNWDNIIWTLNSEYEMKTTIASATQSGEG